MACGDIVYVQMLAAYSCRPSILSIVLSLLLFFSLSVRKSVYGAPVDRRPVSMGTTVFHTG